jgi:hypothetical protein
MLSILTLTILFMVLTVVTEAHADLKTTNSDDNRLIRINSAKELAGYGGWMDNRKLVWSDPMPLPRGVQELIFQDAWKFCKSISKSSRLPTLSEGEHLASLQKIQKIGHSSNEIFPESIAGEKFWLSSNSQKIKSKHVYTFEMRNGRIGSMVHIHPAHVRCVFEKNVTLENLI